MTEPVEADLFPSKESEPVSAAPALATEVDAAQEPAPSRESRPRLLALDAFRGATIAGMILVNNPGSWSHVYPPLLHASWHGWTPTDLVFPFFLWIVGVAITLSLGRRVEEGAPRGPLVKKIVVRTLVLIGLGLFLNMLSGVLPALFGFGDKTLGEAFATLRIPGVLQRIGLCYGITALAFLFLPRRVLPLLCAALLLGYWMLMEWVQVPALDGSGALVADLDTKGDHLAGWLDRTLLGEGHLWSSAKVYDPEGLLSTLPAVGTCLLGLFAGRIVRSDLPLADRILRLFVAGALLVVVGYCWDWFLPINKPIWTSSYAVFTAGQASCALALCLWACDLKGWRRWAAPLRVYGVNPITVFVGSALLVRTLLWIQVDDGSGGTTSLKTWIYQAWFKSWVVPGDGTPAAETAASWFGGFYSDWFLGWADERFASLAMALAWIAGWFVILWIMDRLRIHIRV